MSNFFPCRFLFISTLVIFSSISFADTREDWEKMRKNQPRQYVATRASSAITIDGKLDDAAWQNAKWSQKHADIEGDLKPKPRLDTQFKLLWDDNYFYFGCRLEEPHVWGTLTKHDSVIFNDNDIEIFIDPNGDNHDYFEFEMNALNTGWDLFLPRPYKDGGSADNSWEIPGLKTAVHIEGTLNDPSDTDSFWSVEVAIPWTALRPKAHDNVPPKDGDHWRMGFSRVEWEHEIVDGKYQKIEGKREDNWVWSPQGIIDMHRPERWGYVWFTAKTEFDGPPPIDQSLPLRDALMTIYHIQKAQLNSEQELFKTVEAMNLDQETKAYIGSHDLNLIVHDDGTWDATMVADGIKMKVDHLSKLSTVK